MGVDLDFVEKLILGAITALIGLAGAIGLYMRKLRDATAERVSKLETRQEEQGKQIDRNRDEADNKIKRVSGEIERVEAQCTARHESVHQGDVVMERRVSALEADAQTMKTQLDKIDGKVDKIGEDVAAIRAAVAMMAERQQKAT